jgi:hypothetical protein
VDNNTSEQFAAFIFRVDAEDRGAMLLWNYDIHTEDYTVSQTKDQNLNNDCRENPNVSMSYSNFMFCISLFKIITTAAQGHSPRDTE